MNGRMHGSEASSLRVAKKLSTTSRGALKLARRFGDALVCVRYRIDADSRYRYTTVELLIDKAPIQHRAPPLVGVRVGLGEHALQRLLRAAGAHWDPAVRLWFMPRPAAKALRLMERVTTAKR